MSTGNERLRSFLQLLRTSLERKIGVNDVQQAAIDRMYERHAKKARFENIEATQAAISGFLADNQAAANAVVIIDPTIEWHAKHFIQNALERYTSFHCASPQCDLDMPLLFDLWKFGPGASNGVRGSHFCDKIVQDMTVTQKALPLVRTLRLLNPHLRVLSYGTKDCGLALINGEKLLTVPKNQETDRTIGVQPSGNMALQLAAGIYLEGALRSAGLDISDQQTKNRELARKGSLDGTLCTIDLKSASNLITPALVERLFPKSWTWLLMQLRCEVVELPDGATRKLHMMSTMGNGFTFPMMTLILLALVYGFLFTRGEIDRTCHIDYSKVGVFGDDIIIPTRYYQEFCELLGSAGLLVNHEKSCASGCFRESCGGDFYKGHNIVPFYTKEVTTDAQIYATLNGLIQWCTHNDVTLWEPLHYLYSQLRGTPLLVAEWDNTYSGIQTMYPVKPYKILTPKDQPSLWDDDSPLTLMCFIGGYLESKNLKGRHSRLTYTPRQSSPKYKKVSAKWPKGYLDGHDTTKWSREEAKKASFIIEVLGS